MGTVPGVQGGAPLRLVIDTNRLIAALLRDGTSRAILGSPRLSLQAPVIILDELARHRDDLQRRSTLASDAYASLEAAILGRVSLVPTERLDDRVGEAMALLGTGGSGDLLFLAAAMAMHADGIWTHDGHFRAQGRVRVLTNGDLAGLLEG